MPKIKLRNGRTPKEGQLVKIGQRIGDVFVMAIHFPYPVSCLLRSDHLPSITLTPSQIAPTNPVTITVITALKV